ncbi:MAG: ABC transporter permease, partial [Lachnospiraceae bacterium]|nr:ABC transporter permease [Lachnospiraceae bacterium]
MWEGVKKVIYVITVLLGVMILIFLMLRIIPGDTASVLLNDHVNQEALARMTENLGLDKPLPVQFFRYLTGVLRGDLGQSFYYNRPVLSL